MSVKLRALKALWGGSYRGADNRIDRLAGRPLRQARFRARLNSLCQPGRNELRRRVASSKPSKRCRQAVTTVDDCDLYAERFDPILSEQERVRYHNIEVDREPVADYADRLLAAEALVLVYPVWNEGFPAILKGRSTGIHSRSQLQCRRRRRAGPELTEAAKAGRSAYLSAPSRDHFPAWRSAEARREAFGAVNARSHRSL